MLLWTEQHKIISTVCLSFKNYKKTFAKTSHKTLEHDKIFLNPTKYETTPKSDFTFIVLWLVYKKNLSKVKLMETLQTLTREEKIEILHCKTQILTYQKTLQEDKLYLEKIIQTNNNVYKSFIQNKISFLGFWWYFRNKEITSKIQKRTFNRVDTLLDFFPKIKEYINEN